MSHFRIRFHIPSMALVIVTAALFCALTVKGGIPSLRHDWTWPTHRLAMGAAILDATSGWSDSGMGHPRAYPSDYIVRIAAAFLVYVFGPFGGLIATLFLVGLVCAIAGDKVAEAAGGSRIVRAASMIFITFNPWVYAKIVAGHYWMVLSCAGLALLAVQALRSRVNVPAACLCVLLVPQLQFLILAIPLLALLLLKRAPAPLLVALIVALPVEAGLLMDARSVAQTPYTLQWEGSQSVPWDSAPLLFGYSPGYLQHILWAKWPMAVIVVLSALTVILHYRNAKAIAAALVAALAAIAAIGLGSPAGHLFAAIVLNVPQSGTFRELFNLLALTAIGYCALAALAARRHTLLASLFFCSSLALALAWIVVPPSGYWVDRRVLPQIEINAPPEQRIVLTPVLQPMGTNGFGSGADPDASANEESKHVLNTYLPQYPAAAALGQYVQSGQTKQLAALGAASIVQRSWLGPPAPAADPATNVRSRARAAGKRYAPVITPITNAVPLLSLIEAPAVSAVDPPPGSGNVFFADAAGLRGAGIPTAWLSYPDAQPISFPRLFSDPSLGWVDLNIVASRYPDAAQGIGGALTVSNQILQVQTRDYVLVFVHGRLKLDAGTSVTGENAYRWLHTRRGVHTFQCFGLCVVAASSSGPIQWPLEPRPRKILGAVSSHEYAPWLISAELPAYGTGSFLRFNSQYNGYWSVFDRSDNHAHVRIDGALNGWTVSQNARPHTIYLIETAAAVQFFLACIGMLCAAIVTVYAAAGSLRPAAEMK